jgi:hypothetical protein
MKFCHFYVCATNEETERRDKVPDTNAGGSAFIQKFSPTHARIEPNNSIAPLPWLLSATAAVLLLMMPGCGTTTAVIHLTAPATAISGAPFTITVTATVNGKPDTVINSPIQFTSSDPAAVLPDIYYFTANDAGAHTFTNAVTLTTAGSQSITVTVIGAPGLNATANVEVSVAAGQ